MARVKTVKSIAFISIFNIEFIFIICVCCQLKNYVNSETEIPPLSDDQEATIGCPIPDLRFLRPKKYGSTTTEQPYVTFETTQPHNDLVTTNIMEVGAEHAIEETSSTEADGRTLNQRQTRYTDYNPYAWDNSNNDDFQVEGIQNENRKRENQRMRKNAGRRRLEQHSQTHKQSKREIKVKSIGDVHYIRTLDIMSQLHDSTFHMKNKTGSFQHIKDNNMNDILFLKMNNANGELGIIRQFINGNEYGTTNNELNDAKSHSYQTDITENHVYNSSSNSSTENETLRITFVHKNGKITHKIALQRAQNTDNIVSKVGRKRKYRMDKDDKTVFNIRMPNKTTDNKVNDGKIESKNGNINEGSIFEMISMSSTSNQSNANDTIINNAVKQLYRVKRKSGKATGALSRPKGGSDSGSKSTSRKKDAGYDEEGLYVPHGPDDGEESEEEEEEDSDEGIHFDEVTEVRFPGEIGPIGDRRLCKIRCIKGKWVGPLCASSEDDHGQTQKFQPLYKSCNVNRIPPHLLLSYRNISVNVGWDVPHGHSLQARCKDLGLYKLLGETRVLCSNGLWAPRMPSCVPTTLLTNFSDDSPPSIRIKIGAGSGAFEPSGVLAVLPGSTIYLDCMYQRRRGSPEWTWTGWHRTYQTGWHSTPDEKANKFRLTIKDIQQQESGTYTCTSPRGLTNSIVIIVAMSSCQEQPTPIPPLILKLEGLKLGQRSIYTCPIGYSIEGIPNSTCLASGNWSSPPPVCNPVQCPSLYLEDPHLSMIELNTSAWGKAVFKCSWGYRLSGPSSLECESSGSWSGPVPRCRAIQCTQPILPINGRIDGTSAAASHRKYAVGALVTFSCNEGHLLVGEASIVCTETGFWSHPPPFCKSQCPYPGDPPNGLIAPLKFHYDPGDFLSVQCRPGFVEYGPPERPRCLPDGNWSGPVPQCRNYEEV